VNAESPKAYVVVEDWHGYQSIRDVFEDHTAAQAEAAKLNASARSGEMYEVREAPFVRREAA
jgi:hypothetical protein